jgi:hypothetical protein
VVYWCNSYTIVHCSLDIIEWFKYKLENVFKLYLILIHPPLSINSKPSKCFFGVKEVEYLGHIVSHEGVKVDPNKIKAMMDWLDSQNIKES